MKKYTSILVLVFIVSCTSNTIFKKPDNLIPKDQMIDLLVDMQIAAGARNIKTKDGKRIAKYMHLVYKKYNIDSARFAESNFYYITDIDEYNDILKNVKQKITEKRNVYDKIIRENDSLRRVKSPTLNENPKKRVLKPKLGTPVKK